MYDRALLVVPQSALSLWDDSLCTVNLSLRPTPAKLRVNLGLQVWHSSDSDTRGVKFALSSGEHDKLSMWRTMHGPSGECRCSLLGAGGQEPLGALPSLGMQPGEQGWSWQDTAAPAGDGAWPSTERKVESVGSTALNRQANTCYTDLWAKSLSLEFNFWKYIYS